MMLEDVLIFAAFKNFQSGHSDSPVNFVWFTQVMFGDVSTTDFLHFGLVFFVLKS